MALGKRKELKTTLILIKITGGMKMLIKRVWKLFVTGLVLLVVTACGGGQDMPPQEEPADMEESPVDGTNTEEPAGDVNEDSSSDETNIEEPTESPAEPSTGETGTEAPATDNDGSD
ncbi:Uncharacterised protein [Bacillus freudenreichii]|nr:Uncharacterised protein [Bacillus freudenreichii]